MPIWKYKDKGIIEYLSDSVGFSVITDFDDIKYLQDFVGFDESIFAGRLYSSTLEDVVGFLPYFPGFSFQLTSHNLLSDIVGFNDILYSLYLLDPLEDTVGFNDLIIDDTYIFVTDSIGFDDSILDNITSFNTLIDTSGFNDSPLAHLEFIPFIFNCLCNSI
jgi:hypothetical protein